MNNQNKKYGFIKSKKAMNDPNRILNDNNYQNVNLFDQPNLCNNNMPSLALDNNENAEYYSSDIDDPKYKPNSLLYKEEFYNNNIKDLLNKNENVNYNMNDNNYAKESK